MWLLTREGALHFLLRYKFETAPHKQWLKWVHIWKHFMLNDYLIVPLFTRGLGSNYSTNQRLVNLWWLIMAVLVATMSITAYNVNHDHIARQSCTASFCLYGNELTVSWVIVSLLCGWHFVNRLIFQRIHPNKLQMDLHAQFSVH